MRLLALFKFYHYFFLEMIKNKRLHCCWFSSINPIPGKILVFEQQPKMISSNQISGFINFYILRTIRDMKLIFCKQLDIYECHSLITQFLLGVVEHAWEFPKCFIQFHLNLCNSFPGGCLFQLYLFYFARVCFYTHDEIHHQWNVQAFIQHTKIIKDK